MASAFCPAHITGFFKAELEGKDPNYLGSLGAGFSIQKGVKTTAVSYTHLTLPTSDLV